jgi:hypothetical protein
MYPGYIFSGAGAGLVFQFATLCWKAQPAMHSATVG